MAARPTAFIDNAENRNGNIAPTNNEAITYGFVMSMASMTVSGCDEL